MTRGINRAIVEASKQGIVSSTTLMATARAFDDAVQQAQNLPGNFSVGCHVILLDGLPILPPNRVSSLLQQGPNGSSPEFRVKINDFAGAALTGKIKPEEVEAEATAQMRRLRDAGIQPSHFDCHKHAHMFPAVLQPLLRAGRVCGITAVRNPFGRLFPVPFDHLLRNPKMWRRIAEVGFLRKFATNFRRQVEAFRLRTTDGSVGVVDTGSLDLKSFLMIIETLPEGTWEFVCHPGYNDAELDQVRTRLRQSRETELAVLTSPEARDTLRRRAIQLISYHEL